MSEEAKTVVKKNLDRYWLSILLVVIYPVAQTAKAFNMIAYSSAFLLDLRLCFWLGLVYLLGVEAFRAAIQIIHEFQNPKIKKQDD